MADMQTRNRFFPLLKYISLFAILLIAGCRKDHVEEPIPTPAKITWKEVGSFTHDLRQLRTCNASGDSLLLYSQHNFIVYEPLNGRITNFHLWHDGWYGPLVGTRPALRSLFYVSVYDQMLIATPTHDPVGQNYFVYAPADTAFNGFHLYSAWNYPYYETPAISARNELLMINSGNWGPGPPVAYQVALKLTELGGDYDVDTFFTRKIIFNDPGLNAVGLGNVFAPGDDFFVNSAIGLLRVTPDGQWTNTGLGWPPVTDMVAFNDTLLAIGNSRIVVSPDRGVSWTVAYNVPTTWANMDYFIIEGKIFSSRFDGLYRLDLTPTTAQLVELDNEGLASHDIASVSLCRDSVYVATMSGLFSKPYAEFNKKKE